MSELEKELKELKEAVEALAKTESPRPNLLLKYMSPILAVVVLAAGIVATWTTLKADVTAAKDNITTLEQKVDANETRVREIELKDAGDTQILKNIERDVGDIKTKLDELSP
jgi:uncharacterized membrane protein (DUF106 family)